MNPKSFWRSTTLEEVLSICQEIHDGMEYFLKRFRWNFGYSLDDVETFCRVQATAEAVREAKGPYQKWKAEKSYMAAQRHWHKINAIRHGYVWTRFGDGGRADWIRFYLALGMTSIFCMQTCMFCYWQMMEGRGKDKWI